jgi:hypothetical protein
MKPNAIISLIGNHNIVGATQQELRFSYITANDMSRIFIKYFQYPNVLIVNTISSLQFGMKNRNKLIVYLGNETTHFSATPIFPYYNFNNSLYRNLYFHLENSTKALPCHSPEVRKKNITADEFFIPVYPTTGTDMQKVNLLEKYMQ